MKTQIVLSDSLMEELRRAVPNRRRSQFIAEAIEERLRAMKFQKALKESAGCWTDTNHPDLKTQADVNRFLGRFRARFKRRG